MVYIYTIGTNYENNGNSGAAIETLIVMPHVQTIIKARAFASEDRLVQNGIWTMYFKTGHVKIR